MRKAGDGKEQHRHVGCWEVSSLSLSLSLRSKNTKLDFELCEEATLAGASSHMYANSLTLIRNIENRE